MIDQFVGFCLHRRVAVFILAALLAGYGIYAWETLSVEAYPELGDVAAQVTTQMPGLAAEGFFDSRHMNYPYGIHFAVVSVIGPGATGTSMSAWISFRGASVRSAVIRIGCAVVWAPATDTPAQPAKATITAAIRNGKLIG